MNISVIGLAALSYLAGGIPTGYLLAKYLKGIDIREHGSGNPGAANMYRIVGKGAGLATLAVDSLKGFAPVYLARYLYPNSYSILIACGVLAIVGHIWTVFLNFRGGKGVATAGGVFAALIPKPLGAAIGVFIVGVALTGHISVGSMTGALTLPFFAVLFHAPKPLTIMAFCVSTLVLIKHISNLKRLLQGRELFFKHGKHQLEDKGKKH